MNIDDIYNIPLSIPGHVNQPDKARKMKDIRMTAAFNKTQWPGWLRVERPQLYGTVRTHMRD